METYGDFPEKEPGELAIAFDPDSGAVFCSDFLAKRLTYEDVLEPARNSDLMFVIGIALGKAGEMVESNCNFRDRMSRVRVVAKEFSPDSGPASSGPLRKTVWSRRVQVLIRQE